MIPRNDPRRNTMRRYHGARVVPRAKCCGCTGAFQALRAGSIPVARFARVDVNGEWRSLVAHPAGGRAAAGSNPVSPTTRKARNRGPFAVSGRVPKLGHGDQTGTSFCTRPPIGAHETTCRNRAPLHQVGRLLPPLAKRLTDTTTTAASAKCGPAASPTGSRARKPSEPRRHTRGAGGRQARPTSRDAAIHRGRGRRRLPRPARCSRARGSRIARTASRCSASTFRRRSANGASRRS